MFLSSQIRNSSNVDLVEKYFYFLLSHYTSVTLEGLKKTYFAGKTMYLKACVLVVPDEGNGIDAMPANFDILAKASNGIEAVKLYDSIRLARDIIPCYLFSLDVSRCILGNDKGMPEDFESQLHAIKIP